MRSAKFDISLARLAARGVLPTILAIALTISTLTVGAASAASAEAEDDTLKTFSLADRSNLRRLDNGDFLFRLARDLRTDIVYWAYMGSTRHVVAFAPDRNALADEALARAALLRIADMPRRVGCGVGRIHRSWVYLVPESVEFGASGAAPDLQSVFVRGEVRNDVSGRTPTSLLSYRNFVTDN